MKYRRVLAYVLAMMIALSFCGCGSQNSNAADSVEIAETESAGEQTYAVGTYERKAADNAASGEQDPDAEVISFGSKSIFKGIQIETDENGEIICYESDGELPAEFTDYTEQLLRMPLYELAERLYVIFHLEQTSGQTAYLCAFFDQLATFINEETTDLPTFLNEWDETLCAKPIQSPEVNGIRIISIHK